MAIGQTFGDDLIAAGLGGLPLVWSEDGAIAGRDFLTEAQNTSLDALLARHNPMTGLKAELTRRVNADAETQRLRYITPGNGMQMTYAEKLAQAHAVQGLGKEAADAIKPEDGIAQFPTLAASVGLEAATLWDCAVLVLAKYKQFGVLSNGIERKRLQGKKDIAAAKDVASAQAIYEAIVWT